MSSRRIFLGILLGMAGLAIGACATTPYDSSAKARSDAELQQQFVQADQRRLSKPQGRLIFAGFAMHSQSKAFRSDVLSAEKVVLALDPDAIVFKLDNPVPGQPADWPHATSENIGAVLKKVGALARPEDKVVVLMATHGNVDTLSINFDNKYYPPLNARWLGRALSDLRGNPTVLLLSACYSGSFLEPLSAPSRVILTASAKDRNSFGCQFHSTNTFFIDALFNQPATLDKSLVQLMERARIEIAQREITQRLSPPSMPQMFVGDSATGWANQPLRDWIDVR